MLSLWPQKEWFTDILSLLIDEPLELLQVWNLLVQPHLCKFHRGLGTLWLHVWRLSSVLSERRAFLDRLCWSQLQRLQRSTSALYQSKWIRFLDFCDRRGVNACKASVPQIAEVFLYLCQEVSLPVPSVKGCRAAEWQKLLIYCFTPATST